MRRHIVTAGVSEYQFVHVAAATTAVTPIGIQVNALTTQSITVGLNTITLTTGTTANMSAGQQISISQAAGGTGVAEIVSVISVISPTQFTATFANVHGTNTLVVSAQRGTLLGPVICGGAGSAMTLALYNGHPNAKNPGVQITALSPSAGGNYPFGIACDSGLWYTYTGTTAGSLTIHYVDEII